MGWGIADSGAWNIQDHSPVTVVKEYVSTIHHLSFLLSLGVFCIFVYFLFQNFAQNYIAKRLWYFPLFKRPIDSSHFSIFHYPWIPTLFPGSTSSLTCRNFEVIWNLLACTFSTSFPLSQVHLPLTPIFPCLSCAFELWHGNHRDAKLNTNLKFMRLSILRPHEP